MFDEAHESCPVKVWKINYEKKMEDVPLLDIAIDQKCAFIKINAILV
jgi:hypothetical protein